MPTNKKKPSEREIYKALVQTLFAALFGKPGNKENIDHPVRKAIHNEVPPHVQAVNSFLHEKGSNLTQEQGELFVKQAKMERERGFLKFLEHFIRDQHIENQIQTNFNNGEDKWDQAGARAHALFKSAKAAVNLDPTWGFADNALGHEFLETILNDEHMKHLLFKAVEAQGTAVETAQVKPVETAQVKPVETAQVKPVETAQSTPVYTQNDIQKFKERFDEIKAESKSELAEEYTPINQRVL